MISGFVTTRLEATIPLAVRNDSGETQELEAILDTGFSGSLTLPPAIIRELALPWRTYGNAKLANGKEELFDIYSGTVIWGGEARKILIEAAETPPLVGMALLLRHELRIQVTAGGTVRFKELARNENRPRPHPA